MSFSFKILSRYILTFTFGTDLNVSTSFRNTFLGTKWSSVSSISLSKGQLWKTKLMPFSYPWNAKLLFEKNGNLKFFYDELMSLITIFSICSLFRLSFSSSFRFISIFKKVDKVTFIYLLRKVIYQKIVISISVKC